MHRIAEATFNDALAAVLRDKMPGQKALIGAEMLGALQGGKRPDILVSDTTGVGVVIETEFLPARTVDDDAVARLGCILSNGRVIENVIALTVPKEVRTVKQSDLGRVVRDASYDYCLHSVDESDNKTRWPRQGRLGGNIDALADLIEISLVSEREIQKAQKTLEGGISEAAQMFQDTTSEVSDTRSAISNVLHQKDCLQTIRMAMAIIANALTFHLMIAGERDIPNLDQMREGGNGIHKGDVVRVWTHIANNINYLPIFKTAKNLLLPMSDRLAMIVLETLSGVAQKLAGTGVARSHDLAGRVFQRLIADRKFLATFYTRPTAAVLLSELAVGGGG